MKPHKNPNDPPNPSPVLQTFKHEEDSEKREDIWILSIDGGGIRGVIPAFILCQIQDLLDSTLSQNLKQRIEAGLAEPLDKRVSIPAAVQLAKAFDLMAGTSTGGIITLGLATPSKKNPSLPLHTPQSLLDLYKKNGESVFPSIQKSGPVRNFVYQLTHASYPVEGLEQLLKDYFTDQSLSDALTHVMIPAYELRQERLYVFDTQNAKKSNQHNFLLWQVARSTSAAPTFFTAATVTNHARTEHLFADGGIIANNPSLAAFMRAKTLFPRAQKVTLISLGTGFAPQDNLSQISDGLLGWGPVIASVMMDGTSHFTGQILQTFCEGHPVGYQYLRIQPNLTHRRAQMDEVSQDNINYLIGAARTSFQEKVKDLAPLIQDLVQHYILKKMVLFPDILHKGLTQADKGSLDLENQKMTVVGAWELCTHLQRLSQPVIHLKVGHNPLKDQGALLLSKQLKDLKTFHLPETGLTARGLSLITSLLPLMEDLNIGFNAIGDTTLPSLQFFPLSYLTSLTLSKTGCTDVFLKRFLPGTPQLKSLSLDHNLLVTRPGGELIVQTCPLLENLSLAYTVEDNKNTPDHVAAGFIQALPLNSSLTCLDLSHTGLRYIDLDAFVKKAPLSLKTLKLHFNWLGEDAGGLLGGLIQKIPLKELDVSKNKLQTGGIKSFGEILKQNKTLTILNIKDNLIEEEGMIAFFEAVRACSSLQKVEVGRRQMRKEDNQPNPVLSELKEKLEQDRFSLQIYDA